MKDFLDVNSDKGSTQAHSDLDLNLVDRLHEPGLSCESAGVQDPPGGGNDLAATTVDGVSVESNIVQVEADTAHVFIAQDSLKIEKY